MKQWLAIVDGFYMVLGDTEMQGMLKFKHVSVSTVKELSMHAAKMYHAFFETFKHTSAEQAHALYDYSAE
jgi:hypothetical protein